MKKNLMVALVGALPFAASATLIQPNSAIAGSEFSGSYDIGNTIDGSGLVGGLNLTSTHSNYAIDNHWTTQSGAIATGSAWAEFKFNQPQHLFSFVLWNHRSNIISANPNYAAREFNLKLMDSANNTLLALSNVPAVGGTEKAQIFDFAPTMNVSKVRFEILKNGNTNPTISYTGVGEVAFQAVPEPASMLALGAGLAVIARKRRK